MFLCNETITLICHSSQKSGTEYTPVVIRGASWSGYRALELTDNGVITQYNISVRIPANALPTDVIPRVGDYIFRGELSGSISASEFLCSENCARVQSVRDNRRTADNFAEVFPHWRLIA
ncbi:MAG: hypothetical protein IJF27_03355 [Oscillospiraceae bacterium]|nr:hypothetical protein [Oscillospiraceae bacterium]MBQ3049305.1 hypothetical protein [Oscillospiraceae bacterium]MBQ9938419.1 hypothetical protein [Oscillospiraceae bacterium]